MTKTLIAIGCLVTGVVVGLLLSSVFGAPKSGGVYNNVSKYFNDGISVTGAITATGDATISGGTLNVPGTMTATSTVIAGCLQSYATSTATIVKLVATTTGAPAIWQYGACPNL